MSGPPRLGVFAVYAAALLQGMTLVSFPASANFLMTTHGVSDAQYGAIFLPQVALAVIGAILGGYWAKRLGLERLLALALAANIGSQVALAATSSLQPSLVYPAILVGTALLGLGFGLLGAPLNSLPARYFPQRRDTALVIAHTLVGAGLMLGPLAVAASISTIGWLAFPMLLAGACLFLMLVAFGLRTNPLSIEVTQLETTSVKPLRSAVFWLFVLIAILYAFAEGTFSSWAVVYLHQSKGLSDSNSAAALSVFWAALVLGRLLVSLLVLRVSVKAIWYSMPLLMIVAFLLMPYASTTALAFSAFALAGLSCSAFFPLCIALASARFPNDSAWVSSMMIAALMVGVGLGSFTIGSLREVVSFETLYRGSTLYPIIVLLLAGVMAHIEKTRLPKEAP